MGLLPKVGGGEHGFDFTRLCMNGDAEGEGECPLSPPLPDDVENPAPTDWACVRDNVTGLVWSLGNRILVTWAEVSSTDEGSFIHRANTLARCGRDTGWRLPKRREGYSLMHLERQLPPVDPDYFPILATLPGDMPAYWTADVNAFAPILNHVLTFQWPSLGNGQCREWAPPPPPLCVSEPPGGWVARVLLVNGEWTQMPPPKEERDDGERWDVRKDGLVVTDTATGLMWDRCTWGQSGSDCDDDGTVFFDWDDAMQVAVVANQQSHLGYFDWRMPSARELETLVKIDAAWPAIDVNVFPNTPSAFYWTASQQWLQPGFSPIVWNVDFRSGAVGDHWKFGDPQIPDRSRVRLVRSGQPWAAFDSLTAALTASPTALDFGAVAVGAGADPRTVTLTSISGQPVEIDAIDEALAPFSRTGGDCPAAPFTLDPTESCTLDYGFAPTEMGAFEQTITIAGNVEPVEIALAGSGEIGDWADLGLVLFGVPDEVNPGGELSLVATVANFGPADGADVTVELALPEEFDFVAGHLIRGDGDWSCAAADHLVTCELLSGTLPVGQFAAVLQIDVAVAADAALGPVQTVAEVVSSNDIDPNPDNNTATSITWIVEGPPVLDRIFADGFEGSP